MPLYQYETIPSVPDEPVRRFEVKQSMSEAALTRDPETGKPVRRVISGGYLMLKGEPGGSATPAPVSRPCGTSCGCHP
jgi:predicted nucleic acid-binding Zn ribbon protein